MIKIFCCDSLRWAATSGECLMYEREKRAFSIYDKGSTKYGTYIKYCPFCGCKLPKNLIDEREDVIFSELGKEYLSDESGSLPLKEVPEEFKTDAWWKKRGL